MDVTRFLDYHAADKQELIRMFNKDKFFNFIPLRYWDMLGARLPNPTKEELDLGYWGTLSDKVSILKEAAFQIVESIS